MGNYDKLHQTEERYRKMLEELKGKKVLVGLKQSTEAILSKKAEKAYLASDTDSFIKDSFLELCAENDVEVIFAESKKMLGKACSINVPAACAVLLK